MNNQRNKGTNERGNFQAEGREHIQKDAEA